MSERRRLSRTLTQGHPTARGETRLTAPRVTGKLWRPDVVVLRADEVNGEVAQDEESPLTPALTVPMVPA